MNEFLIMKFFNSSHCFSCEILLLSQSGGHMQFEHSAFNPPSRIDIRESWEVNHWCEELNLRADELREIVLKVGSSLEAIRDYLARRNMQREASFS
jgi:hypothetical protein